jgi:hypothetical protein
MNTVTPDALPREQSLQFPLDRRMDRPWSWFGFYREEKNLLPYWESSPNHPVYSSVSILDLCDSFVRMACIKNIGNILLYLLFAYKVTHSFHM